MPSKVFIIFLVDGNCWDVCICQNDATHVIIQMSIVVQLLQKYNLRPYMTLYIAIVHIMAIAGMIYSLLHPHTIFRILAINIAFHVLYAFGITGGAHRLWAHKTYFASSPLRFILMLCCSGANQGSIYHWARDHRLHHKYSDTLLDPHSMQKGFFFAHIGWLLTKKSPQLVNEGRRIEMSDIKADWVVSFQRHFNWLLTPLMCWILPALCFHHVTQAGWLMCLCLANMPYITLLHSTWCVNSICHKFGSRPWNKNIAPTDNIWVSLLTNGEGYHNWHHEYPSDWRASKDHWYMLNLTARVLELCSIFKLCRLTTKK